MKIGVNLSLCATKIDQYDIIPLVAEAGFDACFWTGINGAPQDSTIKAANSIRGHGLIFQSIHAPFNKVEKMWDESEEGEAFTQEMIRWVHQCEAVQVPVLVAHVWKGFYEAYPTAIGIDRFGKLVQEAEKCGIQIAFENTEGENFLEAIRDAFSRSPAYGFCIDTGHELCYNGGNDMIGKYGDKLIATHLNDNLGFTGAEVPWHDDSHLFPFDGIADWKGIAQRLKKVGYNGILTFELTIANKPGRHTHDQFETMSVPEILKLAHQKARTFESYFDKL